MSDLSAEFCDALRSAPAYCFTIDLDWAAESMIEETLAIFRDADVPLTPFLTHASPIIAREFTVERAGDVGVHPNFHAGSSHGETTDAIIDCVLGLWPAARCFRSHGFVDSSIIASAFYARGLRYDSNLFLHLQSHVVPLSHSSGLVRFPVFLEDDVLLAREPTVEIRPLLPMLRTPGLKIFNFHPELVALNSPQPGYHRQLVASDGTRRVHSGRGIRTLLVDLLNFVRDGPGLGILSLDETYRRSVQAVRRGGHAGPPLHV
jgi:hypothetical protein